MYTRTFDDRGRQKDSHHKCIEIPPKTPKISGKTKNAKTHKLPIFARIINHQKPSNAENKEN
jgi:hypothetical protein